MALVVLVVLVVLEVLLLQVVLVVLVALLALQWSLEWGDRPRDSGTQAQLAVLNQLRRSHAQTLLDCLRQCIVENLCS